MILRIKQHLKWAPFTAEIPAEEEEQKQQSAAEVEEMEPKPVIKVAALCGSLRKRSYNRGLLRAGILFYFFFF